MSLNKKRPLAAFYFANRIIQRDFPLRAYVAPNVGDFFMGPHSFSSVNALYLHGVRHPNLLTGACYQDCHALVKVCSRLIKGWIIAVPSPTAGSQTQASQDRARHHRPTGHMRRCENRFMFPHAAIHHSRRSRQALFSSMN
jgi:hypothetical protein